MQTVEEFLAKYHASKAASSPMQSVEEFLANYKNKSILPGKTQITQNFDNYNPELEVFSGGVAKDTNFATNDQTPVSVPQGQWQVVSTYDQANPQGFPGNPDNQGYGNAVMAQNAKTGDRLHFIHLSGVHVKPGDTILGGTVVGRTGSSGNATGPNLGLEYYDQAGQLQDVMQSPYAKSLPVDGQQAGAGGGGGYEEQIGQILSQGANLLGQGINYGAQAIGKGINTLISKPPSMTTLSNPAQQSVLNQKMVSFPTSTPPASPTPQWHKDPTTTRFVPDGAGGFIASAEKQIKQALTNQREPAHAQAPKGTEPNITIPYSQTNKPYTLDPRLSQTILNSFNKTNEATNAATVLNHPASNSFIPSDPQSNNHNNMGENASFRESNVDAVNSDGSIDRGLFRINSNTFAGYMSNPASKAKLAKMGITNWDDMNDPQKNADFAALLQQNAGWGRWFAAPRNLRLND